MLHKDSDFNWAAFERRRKISYSGIDCFIASPEDLALFKLMWYDISKSGKQRDDIEFLLKMDGLNRQYVEAWATKLFIPRHGIF